MKLIYKTLIVTFLLLLETVSNHKIAKRGHHDTDSKTNKNGDVIVVDDDEIKKEDLESALRMVDEIEKDLQLAKLVVQEMERKSSSGHHYQHQHRHSDVKQYHPKNNPVRQILRRRDPIVDHGGFKHNCRYKVEYFYKPIHYMGYKFYQRLSRLVHTCNIL